MSEELKPLRHYGEQIEKLTRERDQAVRATGRAVAEMSAHARARGEAEGRLLAMTGPGSLMRRMAEKISTLQCESAQHGGPWCEKTDATTDYWCVVCQARKWLREQ